MKAFRILNGFLWKWEHIKDENGDLIVMSRVCELVYKDGTKAEIDNFAERLIRKLQGEKY